MSLRNSGHLPIRWIAKRWAAEANRPEDAAEIENDLIDAVLLGEFQFPVAVEVIRLEDGSIPSNYDARLRSLVETFSRDSRPRSAHEFRNYRQAGGAQKVAQEICISIEGLRRWTGREEFNTWAALRGLEAPAFLMPREGQAPDMAIGLESADRVGEPLYLRRESWAERQRCLMDSKDPNHLYVKTYRDAAKIIAREENVDPNYVERECRRVRNGR